MNYRHAFHAGNFVDCVKHAGFLWMLRAMQRKEKPILLLDTHAGIGRYDLASGPAAKTGEWLNGIAKVMAARPVALADFCSVIESLGLYPGSPVIAASLLRAGDRLICCELHHDDAPVLRRAMAAFDSVAVHERDGYEALKAFLPPAEKRGLVLIDPPFEAADEYARVVEHVAAAWRKFKSGVFVVWYPIKSLAPERAFFEAVKAAGLRDVVAAKILVRPALDAARLNGCGLLVINPPFGFEAAMLEMLQGFVAVFGEAGAGCAVERVVNE
jgi:23S rRNA (adenine2030-N6)-methyltransferase